jgi:hypothetical protein
VFSPNGDGCHDVCTITLENVPYPAAAEISVRSQSDNRVIRQVWLGESVWLWDGTDAAGHIVPDGEYSISVRFQEHTYQARAVVDNTVRFLPPVPYEATEFPVLMWLANPFPWEDADRTRAYLRSAMVDLGRLNVDVAFPVWGDRQSNPTILEEADAAGLRAVLHLVDLNKAIASGHVLTASEALQLAMDAVVAYLEDPRVYGYSLIDEPWPQHQDNLRTMARAMATVDPRRPTLVCLNGTGLDAAAYFIGSGLPVLVHDNYPITASRKENPFPHFVADMAAIYQGASALGCAAWLTPQAFGSPAENIPCPSPEEFEAMIYLALGQGIRGIFHFIHHGIATVETAPDGSIRGPTRLGHDRFGSRHAQTRAELPRGRSTRASRNG